jgi:AmmeMemoRadiSam system protein A
MYTKKEELAKKAIEHFIHTGEKLIISESEVPKEWLEKSACFVTIKMGDRLRGCIGSIETYESLYLNIISNAISAGFNDPRFPSLESHELSNLNVEVSVLTKPQEYRPKSSNDLLDFLQKEKPGLIIEKGYNKALFLPQVWEELPDPESFLSHLCLKAGLDPECWKEDNMKYQTFNLI